MENKTDVIVVCSCDDNYASYCGVMLTSLLHNNKDHHIVVNILSSNMSDGNREKFGALSMTYGQEILIKDIDDNLFQGLYVTPGYITKESYFRLLIPSLFPQYEKVLYLDCDMIIRHDVSELWNTDLSGFAAAGVKDKCDMIDKNAKRLGYPVSDSYYNAGMTLFNVSFLRGFDFERKVNDFIRNKADIIRFYDQDILNYICHGYFKEVSVRWNMLDVFLMNAPYVISDNRDDLEKWIENPGIIHFSDKYKPWNIECYHQYSSEFWKYVKISPWTEIKPVRRFKGKQELKAILKIKCKRTLGFLGIKKYSLRKLILKEQ